MELQQLDNLETKINQAVKIIEKLKLENRDLLKANGDLRAECRSKDFLIQQLREENEQLKQVQQSSSLGKEKEEKIRIKVQQMLARLDELEQSL